LLILSKAAEYGSDHESREERFEERSARTGISELPTEFIKP
jgi:hypothetical protein